jgi:hypothetical protein
MNRPDRLFLILRGLDRMIELGRSFEFQHLGFPVAKGFYSDLALSEWSHDGGEDAFALPGPQASPDTPVLACSFTNTLAKVKGDCERLRQRAVYPPAVLFVTPRPVGRTTIDKWKADIEKEFGHGLEVLSRKGLAAPQEARVVIEQYRRQYNEARPHSSLGYHTPAEVGTRRAPIASGLPPEHDREALLAVT